MENKNRSGSGNSQFHCLGCRNIFQSSRALNAHWQNNKECSIISNSKINNSDELLSCHDNGNDDVSLSPSLNFSSNLNIDEEDSSNEDKAENDEHLLQASNDQSISNIHITNMDPKNISAKLELLKMLNTAKAPLYLFDDILTWAKTSVNKYDVDFGSEKNTSRQNFVQKLKSHLKLDKIEPSVKNVTL